MIRAGDTLECVQEYPSFPDCPAPVSQPKLGSRYIVTAVDYCTCSNNCGVGVKLAGLNPFPYDWFGVDEPDGTIYLRKVEPPKPLEEEHKELLDA